MQNATIRMGNNFEFKREINLCGMEFSKCYMADQIQMYQKK